jgi:hypothetical protein
MAIQWFPGHMHLTRKAIGERIKEIDVVIEMLDARLPGSSANPMLAELIKGKPALKVLSKQDLADPERTALWLAHYNALPGVQGDWIGHQHAFSGQSLDGRLPRPGPFAWQHGQADAGAHLWHSQRGQVHPDQHLEGPTRHQNR